MPVSNPELPRGSLLRYRIGHTISMKGYNCGIFILAETFSTLTCHRGCWRHRRIDYESRTAHSPPYYSLPGGYQKLLHGRPS